MIMLFAILAFIPTNGDNAGPFRVSGKLVQIEDLTPDMVKRAIIAEGEGLVSDDGVFTSHLNVSWIGSGAAGDIYRTEILYNYEKAFPNRILAHNLCRPFYGQLEHMKELRVVYMLKSPEITMDSRDLDNAIDAAVNDCIAEAGNLDGSCFREILPVKLGLDER